MEGLNIFILLICDVLRAMGGVVLPAICLPRHDQIDDDWVCMERIINTELRGFQLPSIFVQPANCPRVTWELLNQNLLYLLPNKHCFIHVSQSLFHFCLVIAVY